MNQVYFSNRGIAAAMLAAALVLIAIAGCGGGGGGDATTATGSGGNQAESESQAAGESTNAEAGGDGGETTAPAGSKARFIAEADAICEKATARTEREFFEYSQGQKGSGSGAKLALEITTQAIVPGLEERIEGIRALSRPPSAEQAAKVAIAGFERLLKSAEADPAGFESKSAVVLPKVQKAISRQGFEGCAGFLG